MRDPQTPGARLRARPRTRQRPLAALLAAIGLVGIAALVATILRDRTGTERRRETLDRESQASAGALDAIGSSPDWRPVAWRVGERRTYALALDTEVHIAPTANSGSVSGDAASSTRQRLTAQLHVQAIERTDDRARVGLELSNVRVSGGPWTTSPAPWLNSTMLATYLASGEIVELRFESGLPELYRGQLEELLRLLEFVVPQSPPQPGAASSNDSETRWRVEQEHTIGRYVAEYTLAASGVVERRKLRYVRVDTFTGRVDETSEVRIESSSLRVTRSRASWCEEIRIAEALVTPLGRDLELRTVTDGTLRAVADASPGDAWMTRQTRTLADVTDRLAGAPGVAFASGQERDDRTPARTSETREASATDLLSFEKLLLGADASERARRPERLADLSRRLRQIPDLALEIPRLLRAQEISDRTASELFLALERAATPESQSVLTGIVGDESWSSMSRLRAIAAMAGLREPGEDAIETLWRARDRRESASAIELSNAATAAIAAIAANLRASDPERYPRLRERLIQTVDSASSESERAIAVRALGNTADETLLPLLETFLHDPRPALRESAARAMGTIGAPGSVELLTTRIEVEPQGAVRAALASALWSTTTMDEPSLAVLTETVRNERHSGARHAMVRLLTKHAAERPETRAILETLLREDPSERVRETIARSLFGASSGLDEEP